MPSFSLFSGQGDIEKRMTSKKVPFVEKTLSSIFFIVSGLWKDYVISVSF